MAVSSELVVIFAAVGAVIFLFLMDYYYHVLENRSIEKPHEIEDSLDATLADTLESSLEGEESDEPNVAA